MSDALARLPHADPERLRVRWNGRELEARRGDSMAAALYAAGHRQLALSRKFHTPRGLSGSFVAGHLANVAGLPDCRLDRTPVAPGLHARRQGTWPAPGLDLLSLARVLPRRWLRAGFEHPRLIPDGSSLWRPWERMLAFAAGVGELSPASPGAAPGVIPGRRLRVHTLVVGGGPAGRAAACAATGPVLLVSRGDPPGNSAAAAGIVVAPLPEHVAVLGAGLVELTEMAP